MKDLDHAQKTVGEWGEETFPNATTETIVLHLAEERAELHNAVLRQQDIDEEAADCLLLLLHLAHREGFSLFDAAVAKHGVNVGRTWEADGGDKGYRKHVEETNAPVPGIVTCQACGNDVPKRSACGVGSTYRMVWTCNDCIKKGAMDRVFTPIGKTIASVTKKVSTNEPNN